MNKIVYLATTNEKGVRESTNGCYTGAKDIHGTIMQDAAPEAINEAYSVEESIVRQGTIMGDAAEDANMPEVDDGEHPALGGQ